MLELLQRIFIGHNHKWEIIEAGKVVDEYGKTYIGSYYQVQCSICGKIKRFQSIA
jgi:hypothetical protein